MCTPSKHDSGINLMNKHACTTIVSMISLIILLFKVDGAVGEDTWKLLNRLSFHQAMLTTATSRDGFHAMAAGRFGRIYVTSDSGDTWSERGIEAYETIMSAAYFSDSGVVAVGESGGVYRTDNHFRDWQRVTVDVGDTLTCVRAISERAVIVTGITGAIYRSTNAGRQWSRVHAADAPLRAVANSRDGRFVAVGDRGTVLVSRDSGVTWERSSELPPDTVKLQRVSHVVDSTWMIAGAPSYLAQSLNGGRSWIRRIPKAGAPNRYFEARAMSFSDNGVGMLIDNDWYTPAAKTLFSLDSGRTWREGQCATETLSMTEKLSMKDVAFFPNSTRGVLAGTNNRVSVVQLRPEEWYWPYVYARFIKVADFLDSASVDLQPAFTVPGDSNTYLWCLRNGKVNSVIEYSGLDDVALKTWIQSDSTGWITAYGYDECVYNSASKPLSTVMHILADSVVRPDGYMREFRGHVISTRDGGQTWQRTVVPGASHMYKFLWKSPMKGLIEMRHDRRLVLTEDGGKSWDLADIPEAYYRLSLETISHDGTSFIVVGIRNDEAGRDLLSSPTGRDWKVIASNLPNGNYVFRDGRLLVIMDSLATYHVAVPNDAWSAAVGDGVEPSGAASSDVGFHCYAGGVLVSVRDNGRVFTSSNDGVSFEGPIRSACLDYIDRVDRSFVTSLFSLGQKVYFGKTSNHVICGTIKSTTSSVNDALDIYTNPPYPNPFHTETKIRISWYLNVSPQSLSLRIYDQYGAEVSDLTTQLRAKAENHASVISWNADGLPNGVYFVVCRSGREVSSQKVVLSR
ncbi:MAG: T9SS type A sorting domain-containing protein [Candidatus Kapabacteria bacterium]|nr:T9SS type A sorting domain-containing protein [Candidatus Kapabacteria bacterium]